MSWGGFKKSINRAGTQLMQKTGQLERSDDSRFKEEEHKYRELEKHASALLKCSRDYLDSIRLLSASEARIGDTIEGFYHDNSEPAIIATSYKRALEELDARTAKELDAPYRATVLDPIGKLCSYFPEVNKLIDKRGRKVRIFPLHLFWIEPSYNAASRLRCYTFTLQETVRPPQ